MVNDQINWDKDNFENIEEAWKGDLWDRERLGIQLTKYVDRLQCGAVLALDARWGEGKTWFVRNWAKHLSDTDHNVIYLDAFANDYLDDPFLTIAAEISQAFKNSNEITDEDIQDFNSKTASVLISLAAVIPMIAVKAGLHWVGLGGAGEALKEVYEDGKDVYDTASEEIASKVKEHIENKIKNHHIEKQTIIDFKHELIELAEKLENPLVFIIDELDRCRPDFAIRLIERIKHFFDIKKIVFVLVMDKTQFSKVVCHNYGYDEKLGEEYLDKFVDFWIPLPEVNKNIYNEFISVSVLKKIFGDVGEFSDDVIFVFYESLNRYLSPRKIKKIINIYALLKTGIVKRDMFLILAILHRASNLIEIFYNLKNNFENKEYANYIRNAEEDCQKNDILKPIECLQLFEDVEKVHRTQYGGGNHDKVKKEKLLDIFSKCSVAKLSNLDELSIQFDDYLNTHL